jgi:hypothetical protein
MRVIQVVRFNVEIQRHTLQAVLLKEIPQVRMGVLSVMSFRRLAPLQIAYSRTTPPHGEELSTSMEQLRFLQYPGVIFTVTTEQMEAHSIVRLHQEL